MATWALIENVDNAISYGGPWNQLTSGDLDFDLSGNSAHFLQANVVNDTTPPATLTFNFTGSEIGIYGIASIFNTSVPNTALPVWECAVDSNLLQNGNPYGSYPLQSYCEASGLDDDIPHLFELIVSQSGSGFWIDFLRFLVGPRHFASVPSTTAAWIGASDPRFSGHDWVPIGDGFRTTQAGPPTKEVPVLSFVFTGSSVTWYGLSKTAMSISDPTLPALMTNDNRTGEGFYTIDDASESHDFSANVLQDVVHADANPYSVVLFTTPPMDIGVHTVNIYYDVNSTVWPLTLDSLTVTDAFSIAPSFFPFPSSSAPANHKSKKAVIGGVVGGVLGGLVLILLILFIRRKWMVKRREERKRDMISGIERNDIKLRPFTRLEDAHVDDIAGRIDALQEH